MTEHMVAGIGCADADELAGLYVLDALGADEYEQVRAHLAGCPESHAAYAEVGSVVPALAMDIEPIDAPADLKARVMAAIAAEPAPQLVASADLTALARGLSSVRAATKPAASTPAAMKPGDSTPGHVPEPVVYSAYRRAPVMQWILAAAAVLVIAALGSWTIVLQTRISQAEQRAAVVAQALGAGSDPTAEVATLHGTGDAAGASGFAAFPHNGTGYIVLVGLHPAPAGKTYQAWYLVGNQATSAGLITVGTDGYAVLTGVERLPFMDLVALTLEQAGGVSQPTSAPIVTGAVHASSPAL